MISRSLGAHGPRVSAIGLQTLRSRGARLLPPITRETPRAATGARKTTTVDPRLPGVGF